MKEILCNIIIFLNLYEIVIIQDGKVINKGK